MLPASIKNSAARYSQFAWAGLAPDTSWCLAPVAFPFEGCSVVSSFIYEGELLTGEYYSLMEVTSVRREGEWTYYDVAKTSIDSDDEIINSSVEVVGRKGMTYYNIEMDDDGEIYYCDELFTAPFNAGDTIGDFEVIRQESVTTAAGTFTAWYCHVSYDEDEVEIYADLWFAPYVGIVKIEIREGDIVAQEMELLSYEGQ
jgi:hypothetical protein